MKDTVFHDILLVEDNIELAELIKAFLNRDGYSVCHVAAGEEAISYLADKPVKIVILDIMLPGIDGFAVCRAVREQGNLPILMISARGDKDDLLNGYELGADDYMEKPVDMEVLEAKIKALLKRSYAAKEQPELIVSGAITVDIKAHRAYLKKEPLNLNVKEYELLLLFVRNPQRTLNKDYIFNCIWGSDSFSENQTLTVHIKMLRTKIEDNPREPKRIKTVWGVGYRYEEL